MSPMPPAPPVSKDPLRIEICRDAADLARHAAALFVTEAGRALGSRRQFAVALSGGATPREAYALLPEETYRYQVVWPAVQVYFTDERCVPPDHPASNFRMAGEAMLEKLGLPQGSVHRMRGEDDPARAAAAYEAQLEKDFGGTPRFDLVLLGMGADGHTASLFPGTDAGPDGRLVAVTRDPSGMSRLTLTPRVINAARTVAVLVAGARKADAIRRVLGAGARDEGWPIQKVRPADGQLIWILDEPAASLLEQSAREGEA